MNEEEYLRGRVEEQIEWYDSKSQWNQRLFKRLRLVELIAAASIPFFAGHIDDLPYFSWITGILGLLVAVLAGLLSLYSFQENWTSYRTTCEGLKREKYLYLTGTEPYNVNESFLLFVQRVESVLSKEQSGWTQYVKSAGESAEDVGGTH